MGEERQRKEAEATAAALESKRRAEEQVVAAREMQRLELKQAHNTQNDNMLEMHKAPSNGGNQSSTQLKMLLGLSSGQNSVPEKQVLADMAEATKATKIQRNAEKKASKAASKKPSTKTVNKSEQAVHPEPNVQPTPSESSPPAPAGSAWGGATKKKPRKSMSEIQQEEARAAAILAAKRGSAGQSSSSGWANVAAGSTG